MNNINPLHSNNQQNNKKPYDFIGAIAGTGTAIGALHLSNKSLYEPIAKMFRDQSSNAEISKLNQLFNNTKVNGTESVSDYLKNRNISYSFNRNPYGAAFEPIKNHLYYNMKPDQFDKYGKSILAHELGHTVKLGKHNPHYLRNAVSYGLSRKITKMQALAQLLNCFNNDDESRQKIGRRLSVTGGVASLPMIAEEIGASMRGSKILGLKRTQKAKSFIGLASYIAVALHPAIIYNVSETTRKFLKTLRNEARKNPEIAQEISNLKNQDIKVDLNT